MTIAAVGKFLKRKLNLEVSPPGPFEAKSGEIGNRSSEGVSGNSKDSVGSSSGPSKDSVDSV